MTPNALLTKHLGCQAGALEGPYQQITLSKIILFIYALILVNMSLVQVSVVPRVTFGPSCMQKGQKAICHLHCLLSTLNSPEGCNSTIRLVRQALFQQVLKWVFKLHYYEMQYTAATH